MGIPIHLLVPNPNGRILSNGNVKGDVSHVELLGVVCDSSIKLPDSTNHSEYGLTGVTTAVTCPACRRSPEFQAIFKEQFGVDAPAETRETTKIPEGEIPLIQVPVPDPVSGQKAET